MRFPLIEEESREGRGRGGSTYRPVEQPPFRPRPLLHPRHLPPQERDVHAAGILGHAAQPRAESGIVEDAEREHVRRRNAPRPERVPRVRVHGQQGAERLRRPARDADARRRDGGGGAVEGGEPGGETGAQSGVARIGRVGEGGGGGGGVGESGGAGGEEEGCREEGGVRPALEEVDRGLAGGHCGWGAACPRLQSWCSARG